MYTTLISHCGSPPEGYDVPSTGLKIFSKDKLCKYILITNTSDTPVYLALWANDEGTCAAEVGKGIYLAAEGGAYELSNVNMCYNDIWAIHSAAGETKRVCVQLGK